MSSEHPSAPELHSVADSPEEEPVWEAIPPSAKPIYKIDERPDRWWESIMYGWQHTLVDISPFVLPLAIAGALGMSVVEQSRFINYCLMAMGIATLIQTTIGNRLPLIQGPSATIVGTLVPLAGQAGGPAMWGGIIAGGFFEMLVGASRLLKYLRKLFPAVVSGIVVISIGFSLGQLAIRLMIGAGRYIDLLFAGTVILMIFVMQILFRDKAGGILSRGAIFISIWVVGLGLGSALGQVNWSLVDEAAWFSLPVLFPFGNPWSSWEYVPFVVIGVMAGYLGSIIESLGDYAATCVVAGEKYTVRHMNKGIFAEGLGSIVASLFGGLPCTSYTQNIGIIATTRVASRFVVQIAAVILILYGLCPKFGALLIAIPRSVLGGVFVIVCGLIVVSGFRLLQTAKATTANGLLVGTTLILAIGIPLYTQNVLGADWLETLPSFARLVSTNTVVLAVISAISFNLLLNILLKGDTEDDNYTPTG